MNVVEHGRGKPPLDPHLKALENEAIHIFREVAAEFERPVMLYSIGKDSSVLLHLALKAFHPGKLPFPLVHINTGWKFPEMITFRDAVAAKHGLELISHTNPEGLRDNVTPFSHGSARYTDIMKTQALKQALDMGRYDAAFGGARRDEEASRAKERIYSFRTPDHAWDPRNQRPELWSIYNGMIHPGESVRAFPLSNWTEVDIWRYIQAEHRTGAALFRKAPQGGRTRRHADPRRGSQTGTASRRTGARGDGALPHARLLPAHRRGALARHHARRGDRRARNRNSLRTAGPGDRPRPVGFHGKEETRRLFLMSSQSLSQTAAEIESAANETSALPRPETVARQARPLRFITCGSVDDGKSTLIGRLLWDTKAVKEDQAATLRRDSTGQQNELGLPDFALLLDGLQAEREQGITIDVAYRYFATDRRSFIVADTPGHVQYTRNMATGASTADLAVLLVDARAGILEQTRRHATIAALMGIRQFVLAVNKIDLAQYDEARFRAISRDFKEIALSLGVRQVTAIPVSALKGENIVTRGDEAMPWYDGPALVEILEKATQRTGQTTGFRLPVQRVSRPGEGFRGYQGTVAGGSIKPGDSVVVLPSGIEANVKAIVTYDLVRNAAVAGDAITLVLDRPVDVSRGDMIAAIDQRPQTGRAFIARMVALSPDGIVPGKRYWLKAGSRRQRVMVRPTSSLDLATGNWDDASFLPVNGIGVVELDFEDTAIFDTYETNRETGAFILIDPESLNTVAGGMIESKRSKSGRFDALPDADRATITLPARLLEAFLKTDFARAHAGGIRVTGPEEGADEA
jgi:sulfate adenylyltransferase subunit 1